MSGKRDFGLICLTNQLLFKGETKMNDQLIGHDVWEHTFFPIYDVDKESEKQIEKEVLEWLKKDDTDGLIEIPLCDRVTKERVSNRLQFHKAEINIKVCSNVWERWRIASCTNWPKIISYRVKEIGVNDDFNNSIVLTNEIRGFTYSFKEVYANGEIKFVSIGNDTQEKPE